MLKKLSIENYKSLKDVTVTFKKGINIIIGKNGTGKSNLLEFISNNIRLDSIRTNNQIPKRGIEYTYDYIFEAEENEEIIDINVTVNNEKNTLNKRLEVSTTVSVTKTKQANNSLLSQNVYTLNSLNNSDYNSSINLIQDQIKPVFEESLQYLKFNIPQYLSWLDNPQTVSYDSNFSPTYNDEGESLYFTIMFEVILEEDLLVNSANIPNEDVDKFLKESVTETFEKYKDLTDIQTHLSSYTDIEDIRLNKNINAYKINENVLIENLLLEFKLHGTWVPWSYLSDGTKRLFYLISELSVFDDGIYLIEEPELGIHPHQLFKLMDFIKNQAAFKQIILSTHSPMVLDILSPDELDRITIAKLDNLNSSFNKLTTDQIQKAKGYMEKVSDLSYYWLHSDLEN